MKIHEKANARNLRKQGKSIKEIAKIIGVSSSSVSTWVRDIELSPQQYRNLYERSIPGLNSSFSKKMLEERKEYQKKGVQKSKQRDPMYWAGCMLYWAEGSKSRHECKLSNTDFDLMKFWIKFLRECFKIGNDRFKIHIHCYINNELTVSEIENEWLKKLDLPAECLGKTSIVYNHPMSTGRRKNKHVYGVCSLRVKKGTEVVQEIFGGIRGIANIQEDRWIN